MQIKQMVKYRMDRDSGWLTASAFFSGLAIFCFAVFYFVLSDFAAIQTKDLVFQVVIPMVWYVAFIVLLKGIRLNIPLVYGCMGAVYCLMMVIWGFQTPTALGSIGGMIFYILAGAALVVTTLGIIPGKYYLAPAFCAVFLIQIFWRDMPQYVVTLKIKEYLPLLARICGTASIGLLCFGMKGRPVRQA